MENGERRMRNWLGPPFFILRSPFSVLHFFGPAEQEFAGAMKRVPAGIVLLVADPDGEVVIDPAARKQTRHGVWRRIFLQISAERYRPHVGAAATALIEGAQELDTAAGVVLPAVLAVEDHAHQRWLVVGDGGADVSQVAHEVLRRGHRLAALVVEADHVAQCVIPEDDRQLTVAFTDRVRAIQALGVADVPVAVATDEAVRRGSTHGLVSRDS